MNCIKVCKVFVEVKQKENHRVCCFATKLQYSRLTLGDYTMMRSIKKNPYRYSVIILAPTDIQKTYRHGAKLSYLLIKRVLKGGSKRPGRSFGDAV